MSRVFGRIFLTAIFLILMVTSGQAASGNQTMKLKDVTIGKVVQVGNTKFVKVAADKYLALNLCPNGSTYSFFYKGCVVKTTDFAYTGDEQTFTAPADSYYVLEVWGAQGGIIHSGLAGRGGYATGIAYLHANDSLHIVVGSRNYNGAGRGDGSANGANGGGATHMASFNRGILSGYEEHLNELVIVAGGGGGAERATGGSGGGFVGNNGSGDGYNNGDGGSQNAGGNGRTNSGRNPSGNINGAFGQGGDGRVSGDSGSGGGGGFYGGGGTTYAGAGGGGSGYIGSSALLSLTNFPKHMTCYDCLESTESATLTFSNTCASETPTADCSKTGNGAARITQLSVYLGI